MNDQVWFKIVRRLRDSIVRLEARLDRIEDPSNQLLSPQSLVKANMEEVAVLIELNEQLPIGECEDSTNVEGG